MKSRIKEVFCHTKAVTSKAGMAMIPLLFSIVAIVYFSSCGNSANENYVPKPKAFPKMELPVKTYILASKSDLPLTFEIPNYAILNPDSSQDGTHNPGWYNLNFPTLDATLHLTYYRFKDWNLFDSLIFDTRKLVNKHLQKADDILERPTQFINPQAKGLVFSIQGNTATNVNFYVTDSVQYFVRGALYFNKRTDNDSIAPAFQFIEKDIMYLIKTLKWK